MTRLRLGDQLKLLQQQQQALQHEFAVLHRSRRALQLRHALAVQWCEAMAFINLHMATQDHQHVQEADAPTALQQLLEEEVALLQELTNTADCPSLEQLLQPISNSIAPCADPMALMRRILTTPLQPQADTITAHSHAVLLQQTATILGIKLQQVQVLLPWERTAKLQEIAAVWDRYFLAQSSLILLGRQGVNEQALTCNLETMQFEPEAALKHQAAQAAVTVSVLGLQEQQEEIIAVGLRLYCDIVGVIHSERAQLQEQMSQLGHSCSSSNAAAGVMGELGVRHEQLQQQQRLTSRLKVLLHKEYCMRLVACTVLIGRLTYEQLSKMAVLSWPYGMRLLFVGEEIMRQYERADQQRRQQPK